MAMFSTTVTITIDLIPTMTFEEFAFKVSFRLLEDGKRKGCQLSLAI